MQHLHQDRLLLDVVAKAQKVRKEHADKQLRGGSLPTYPFNQVPAGTEQPKEK